MPRPRTSTRSTRESSRSCWSNSPWGCRTHILHLVSARALDIIADARAEGLPLTVETCPHYLCFDADAIPDGAAEFRCCPPIRDRGNREALWDGLREGIIDAVVSDHSPSTAEEKRRGAPDLQQAWGGISGLQVGFSAVAHEARLRGIGIETVSAWMATNTALPAPTAHRLLRTMIARGYVRQLANRSYGLGEKLILLGQAASARG